jgi:hypothetical protein
MMCVVFVVEENLLIPRQKSTKQVCHGIFRGKKKIILKY